MCLGFIETARPKISMSNSSRIFLVFERVYLNDGLRQGGDPVSYLSLTEARLPEVFCQQAPPPLLLLLTQPSPSTPPKPVLLVH